MWYSCRNKWMCVLICRIMASPLCVDMSCLFRQMTSMLCNKPVLLSCYLFLQLWAVKYGVVMIVLIISQKMNGFRDRSVLELACLTLVSFFFCFFPRFHLWMMFHCTTWSLIASWNFVAWSRICLIQNFSWVFMRRMIPHRTLKYVFLSLPNRSAFAPSLFE